jgi:UDP:flavonoid glycosyltransferase YjiC (YdhE family)
VPQGREQPLNAARVVEVGAGLLVQPDARPSELSDAVDVVLSDSRYRSTAKRFAAGRARLGNGQYAADTVESVLADT